MTFASNERPDRSRPYEYSPLSLSSTAQPVPVAASHGKKGKAGWCISAAVDAPVTIAEIRRRCGNECGMKQSELHVLGWEWEMGLYDLMEQEAEEAMKG